MTTPLRVLILEDHAPDAELMAAELGRGGFEPEWQRVDTEPDYLAGLDSAPDVVLADYTLPQFDMLRALQLLQERELDTPFIVVSGTIGEERAAECVRLGAADYLLKDRMGRLGQAVAQALEQQQLRQRRREAERALKESERNALQLAEEQTTLAEIGRTVSSTPDIGEIYRRFDESLRSVIPYDRIVITTLDEAAREVVDEYIGGTDIPGKPQGTRYSMDEPSLSMEVVQSRTALCLNDRASREAATENPVHAEKRGVGLKSLLAVPLVWQDAIVGTLNLHSNLPEPYGEGEVAFVEQVGAQIAGAIANARLHANLEREAHEREVLGEIGRIIGSSLDIDDVYERFAEEVRRLIPFDRIVIAETDLETGASTNLFMAGADVCGWDPGAFTELPLGGPGQLFAKWVGAAEPEPVVFGKDQMRERAESWPAEAAAIEAGLVSVIFVPIMWENAVIAHMALRSRTEDAYSNEHSASPRR